MCDSLSTSLNSTSLSHSWQSHSPCKYDQGQGDIKGKQFRLIRNRFRKDTGRYGLSFICMTLCLSVTPETNTAREQRNVEKQYTQVLGLKPYQLNDRIDILII